MTADVKLLALPELPRQVEGYSSDYWEANQVEGYATDYALACVEANFAVKQAEHEREIEALRAEVERAVAVAQEGARLVAQAASQRDAEKARAERLAEALRVARDYVASELHEERAKFAGHENCSNIPDIEADLHKIDTALHPTAAQGDEAASA